jgi:regulator of protease activity HflC (stomatin/prohibitin superfamily)
MLALKFALMAAGLLLLATAVAIPLYSLILRIRLLLRKPKIDPETGLKLYDYNSTPEPIQWQLPLGLALVACLPLAISTSITVVPSGMGGVRVSQIGGTEPGTLYPGVHFVTPLVETVHTFDLRDHLFTAGVPSDLSKDAKSKTTQSSNGLDVQSREGLPIGLAVTVRYHLDPRRLDHVEEHLPQPVDREIVPPVVASAWRELAPSYTVQEIFSTKREEIRAKAANTITRKLGADGIIVDEVMLRDIQLPEEYSKGLEGLLLKEQENDQMAVTTEIQAKQVRIAELQAEAAKVTTVKQSEAEAQSKVVEAKGEADAMQYTLPLKQKQIEQTKLEAQARKEATIQNAQAEAEAKVIDSKAELQRRNMMTDAEANRVRLMAAADGERMKSEAAMLNESPLLINKIIAERLSDKIQVMMVPSDGKFFFANDVIKSASVNPMLKHEMQGDDDKTPAPHGNQQ